MGKGLFWALEETLRGPGGWTAADLKAWQTVYDAISLEMIKAMMEEN